MLQQISLLPLSLFEYILLNKRKHTDAISLRYNRDVKGLYDLSKICNDVETEPVLQPETSEPLMQYNVMKQDYMSEQAAFGESFHII